MRESGLSQRQSIEALQVATAIDGLRAQIAVTYSETWRDQRDRNLQINEELSAALTRLAQNSGDTATLTEMELDPTFDPHTILRSTISP